MTTREVLVMGAGPFGLSISAHLRGLGVDHMIVGRPADTWRSRMPVGDVPEIGAVRLRDLLSRQGI